MKEDKISAQFDEEVNSIKEIAARSVSPCLTARFIAFSDHRVRSLFIKKMQTGFIFKGTECLPRLIPELKVIHFDFDCAPNMLCLIDPSFAAIVDFVNGNVISIIDPYDPTDDRIATDLTK